MEYSGVWSGVGSVGLSGLEKDRLGYSGVE